MSSKHLTILPAVAALLLTASCSNDDMDGILANGPVAAQVKADISNGQTVSRATVSSTDNSATFETGDVINVVASGTNIYEYTLSGSTWSSDAPYYFQDLNAVTFRGWYAIPTPTDNEISIDTKTQTIDDGGWNDWDILAAPEVSATATSPVINFTGDNAFTHVMSQLSLTFKVGDGIDDLALLTGYELKDLTTDATFNTLTCELTNGSTTGTIEQSVSTVAAGTETVSCDPVILVPQEVTDGKLSLKVTYNGQSYAASLVLPESATAMAAGTHYAYTVNINNVGLEVYSAEIVPWDMATSVQESVSIPITEGYTFTTDEDTGVRSYTVYSESGLLAWSEYTRSGHYDTNCTLANDITLSTVDEGESNWTAVGDNSNPYTGTFAGNGHTITGLTISTSSHYQGLIGCLGSGGVVKDLALKNVSISNTDRYYTGAVVGLNYGGTVTNCYSTGTVSGYEGVGGVVGYSRGIVTACYSTVTVSGHNFVGGVVGYNLSGTVIACYSTGSVSSDTEVSEMIGGVVGCNDSGTVTACYWYNSTTDNGIGYDQDSDSGSDENATKVDGTTVTWSTAAETMNGYLTGWKYVTNDAYDGSDTTIAPLLLEEVEEVEAVEEVTE